LYWGAEPSIRARKSGLSEARGSPGAEEKDRTSERPSPRATPI
jgi:hypothetical protein